MMKAARVAAIFMTTLFGFGLGAEHATADVRVKSYRTKSGKVVQGYTRSSPNKTTADNFSTRGNQNPYTRKWGNKKGIGTGVQTTGFSGDSGTSGWSIASSLPSQSFAPREDIRMNAFEFEDGWFCFDGFEKQGEECVPALKRASLPAKPAAAPRVSKVVFIGGM